MSDRYSEQELRSLFRRNLPPVVVPKDLADDLRSRVLSEVASTYQQSGKYSVTGNVARDQRVMDGRRYRESRRGGFSALSDWLGGLRLVGSFALAGGTVAALLLFFLAMQQFLPMLTDPGSSTASSPETLPVLDDAALTSLAAVVTIGEGNATVLRTRTGQTENLSGGSSTELRPGDELLTLSGAAQVQYFAEQASEISAGARVELVELSQNGDDTTVVLYVHVGETRHFITSALSASDTFEVRSQSASAFAVGTDFAVHGLSATETYFAAYEGVVLIEMDGQSTPLVAGNEVTAITGMALDPQAIAALVAQNEVVDTPATETPEPTATIEPTATATETVEPTATATETPIPTATATETAEPTATDAPTAAPTATSTNTAEPTATDAPTATFTPQPTNTATATQTAVPTATETTVPTATPEPTATATLRPTATPTATSVPVTVRLLSPNNRVSGNGDVLFQWSITGTLEPDRELELIFWKEGQNPLYDGFGVAAPTRASSIVVDLDTLDDRLGGLLDAGEYLWGLREVVLDPEYQSVRFLGESRLFRYDGKRSTQSPSSGE